jgi:SAM-dependent methyltransferase
VIVRPRVLTVRLLIRLVERVASLVSSFQMLLYGLLPVLLPPEELTGLVRSYYGHSYEKLTKRFAADTHTWTLEHWEEGVVARHMTRPGTVVVLGSGLGRESIALAQRGHQVIAVDTNLDGLQMANRRAAEQNVEVTFVQADFQRLPLIPSSVDYVFMSGVMYSAIPGRRLRQACVRHFRETKGKDGTVILNFILSHELQTRTHRAIHHLNRWLMRLPGSNHAYQLGDVCSHGHFMHAFVDEAEIRSELMESGATILELNWREGFAVIA